MSLKTEDLLQALCRCSWLDCLGGFLKQHIWFAADFFLRYIDSGTWNNVRAFLEELSSKVSSLVGNHQSAITHFF